MTDGPDARKLWQAAETILLRGGRICDPASGYDRPGDVFLRRGRIEAVAERITREADLEIDTTGLVLAPGLGDMHVHLREPGYEDAETIATGTRAAAAGGFTRVACMPNTDPPIDSRGMVEFVLARAAEAGHCRVFPIAAATKGRRGRELTEMFDLRSAGAIGVSDDGDPVRDSLMMRRVLEYASTAGLLPISHAEDTDLSRGGVMNEGFWSTKLGLAGIPAAAESIAVARDIRLAELARSRLHIAHVSARESVELIRVAKRRGVAVTAETAPHYFALTEKALEGYDSRFRVNPPLRSEEDRKAIIEALRDGTIDVIATDHAPHTDVAKDVELEAAPPGMIGLETALAVALEVLHHGNGLPILRIVEALSSRPAEIAGWGGGAIIRGEPADLCLFDPEAEWEVRAERFHSKARNCPFEGWKVRGRVRLTVCEGRVTHEEGLVYKASERLLSAVG